jgi:cytoskeletal protein CcmA (bactofilin family)
MRKKDKMQAPADPGTISTLLGADTSIEGTFAFKETIRLDGRIKGSLISETGTVIVGEKAVVDADVKVGVAIIRGTVNGCVEASSRIEIYAPARVDGDISAPTVTIDTGVVFNGTCRMESGEARRKGGSAPPEAKPEKGDSEPQTS